jgi:hypothetical protein
MSIGNFKHDLFNQFSPIAKAMSNGYRLELLEFLDQGERSVDALTQVSGLTVAEMHVTGVSTRRVEKVMQSMGIENISSTQVSRANKQMDEALNAWRDRPSAAMFENHDESHYHNCECNIGFYDFIRQIDCLIDHVN